ncbi:MAG: stage V sporulation protein SpoVM [Clostridia bacterium]|nr:stage V sporulation protein SpoVM [Clostridia bacterium]
MKFVVVDNPKFWGFFLRRIFRIKKHAQQDMAV